MGNPVGLLGATSDGPEEIPLLLGTDRTSKQGQSKTLQEKQTPCKRSKLLQEEQTHTNCWGGGFVSIAIMQLLLLLLI